MNLSKLKRRGWRTEEPGCAAWGGKVRHDLVTWTTKAYKRALKPTNARLFRMAYKPPSWVAHQVEGESIFWKIRKIPAAGTSAAFPGLCSTASLHWFCSNSNVSVLQEGGKLNYSMWSLMLPGSSHPLSSLLPFRSEATRKRQRKWFQEERLRQE